MAVNVTFKITSVTWNNNTWDKSTSGGPIRVEYSHSARVEENRVADDEYPTVIALPDKSAMVSVTLREVKQVLTLGDKNTLVMTIAGKSGTSVTITLANMVLVDIGGSQDRGSFGAVVLRFAYEGATGTTVPLS